jgi:hypothetical protein
MTIDPTAILATLMAINWNAAMGLVVAPVFFLLATWYLTRGDWPWEPKYRAVSLAGVFLLLGSWSAAGVAGVSSAFWAIVNAGTVFGLFGGALWMAREWFRRLPLVGQVYEVKGIGEVTIEEVRGLLPIDAVVVYVDPAGEMHTVHAMRTVFRARLLEDRLIEAVETIE